jgi:hypothetical protein
MEEPSMSTFRKLSMTLSMLSLMLVTAACASMPINQDTASTEPASETAALTETQVETQSETPSEPQAETQAETAAETTELADGYSALLDWYHHQISTGWADYDKDRGNYGVVPSDVNDTGDMVSYMWYRFEQPDLTQSGYQLLDIDHDGTEELIVGVISDYDGSAAVYDVYTIRDGKPALLASGGERVDVSVGDGVICVSGSGGAALYIITMHHLTDGRAVPFEEYKSDYDADADAPWFYSNEPVQGDWGGYEFQNWKPISQDEFEQCGNYTMYGLSLQPFSGYTPGSAA